MFEYFRNRSSNAHEVCCEDSLTKSVYMTIASLMTLTFTQGHICLKLDYFLTCNISDNIEAIKFILGTTVDLWHGILTHAHFNDLDLENVRKDHPSCYYYYCYYYICIHKYITVTPVSVSAACICR